MSVKSIFLRLVFSVVILGSISASAVSYKIARTPRNGLELELIWPTNGEECNDFSTALDAIETLCEENGGNVLMLLQVIYKENERSQKTIQFKNC